MKANLTAARGISSEHSSTLKEKKLYSFRSTMYAHHNPCHHSILIMPSHQKVQ